jgi:hypothetical protein
MTVLRIGILYSIGHEGRIWLDVESQRLLERFDFESMGLGRPGFADELVWGEASEGLEPPAFRGGESARMREKWDQKRRTLGRSRGGLTTRSYARPRSQMPRFAFFSRAEGPMIVSPIAACRCVRTEVVSR